MCSSSRSKPARSAQLVGARRTRRDTRSMSARSIARGAGQPCVEGKRRRAERLPRALVRASGPSPSHGRLHEPLRPACASCMPIFARRVRVHEVDDALPRRHVRVVPHPRAAGRDAALGRDVGHLGDHEPRAADRAAAEVHEVPVVGHAVAAPSTGTSATRRCGSASVSPRSVNGANIGGGGVAVRVARRARCARANRSRHAPRRARDRAARGCRT